MIAKLLAGMARALSNKIATDMATNPRLAGNAFGASAAAELMQIDRQMKYDELQTLASQHNALANRLRALRTAGKVSEANRLESRHSQQATARAKRMEQLATELGIDHHWG